MLCRRETEFGGKQAITTGLQGWFNSMLRIHTPSTTARGFEAHEMQNLGGLNDCDLARRFGEAKSDSFGTMSIKTGHLSSNGGNGAFQTGYFFGDMTSFAAFATRKFTTVLAGILIASPVCGLRPMWALRFAFTRRPTPGRTNTPFFLVSLIAVSARCSRNAAAVLLGIWCFSA